MPLIPMEMSSSPLTPISQENMTMTSGARYKRASLWTLAESSCPKAWVLLWKKYTAPRTQN